MSRRRRSNQSKQLTTQNNNRPSRNIERGAEIIHQEAHFFNGPIPPAEELEKYSDIIPDGANRIMLMAEQQAQHRIELENKVINNDISNSRLGMIFGFILQLVAIVGSVIIAITQSMWEGMLMAIGVIVIGIVNLRLAKQDREKELSRHKDVQ
jgi:uncharacterized membrane protein